MKKNTIPFDFDTTVFIVNDFEIYRSVLSGEKRSVIDTIVIDSINKEIMSGRVRYFYSGYNKRHNYLRSHLAFRTREEAVAFVRSEIKKDIDKLTKLINKIK